MADRSAAAARAASTCIRHSMSTPSGCARVSDFVEERFLPRLRALATCDTPGACRDPASDRMSFVDTHQAEFANHGFCARSPNDPAFDRECFLENGEMLRKRSGARPRPIRLRCNLRARDFRPYAPRARWIRTANDSYFTAMTFPEGISSTLQPSDLHDATWGATSAVYGGAVHPTAEGHAAMADAALPVATLATGIAGAAAGARRAAAATADAAGVALASVAIRPKRQHRARPFPIARLPSARTGPSSPHSPLRPVAGLHRYPRSACGRPCHSAPR